MNIYFCFVLKQESSSGSRGAYRIKTHDSKRNPLHALSTISICRTSGEGTKVTDLATDTIKPLQEDFPKPQLLEERLQTAFQLLTPDVTFYIRCLTCPGQPFVKITQPFWQGGTSARALVQPPALCRVSYKVWTVCSELYPFMF